MAGSLTRGVKPRTAGITEGRLSAITGLRSRSFSFVTTGGVTNESQATSVLFGHTVAVSSTWQVVSPATATGGGVGTWLNGKLPFPATPCITFIFAVPVLNRIRLRVRGLNQFGVPQVEELPEFTMSSVIDPFGTPITVDNGFFRVWCSLVFSEIHTIEYQFPDAIGVPLVMSCGLFFTWNPVLYNSVYDITSPTAASFYVFPEAQGFGTRAEVSGAVGASPSLAPEVANLIITGPTPSATTIANVPPAGSIPTQGGYVIGSTYSGPTIDAVNGVQAPNPIAVTYSQLQPEPNKVRLSAIPGLPILCLDQVTPLGDASGALYTPAVIGNPGTPEIPSTLIYHVHIRPLPRPAVRLAGPSIAP